MIGGKRATRARELRYSRQPGDRQHAFGHPVGRHGANDLQPVPPESADVRTQGGGKRHLDSHGDSGAADRERAVAALVLVLAVEQPECCRKVGRQRSGRSVPVILARADLLVTVRVAGRLIMHDSLGRRARAPPDKRSRSSRDSRRSPACRRPRRSCRCVVNMALSSSPIRVPLWPSRRPFGRIDRDATREGHLPEFDRYARRAARSAAGVRKPARRPVRDQRSGGRGQADCGSGSLA